MSHTDEQIELHNVERSWVGVVTNDYQELIGDISPLVVREIANQQLQEVLQIRMGVQQVYAICEEDKLIFFAGYNANNTIIRHFNIVEFHEPCSCDDDRYEPISTSYFYLIVRRANVRKRFVTPTPDEKSTSEWCKNEAITYFNRYYALLYRNGKTFIAMKSWSWSHFRMCLSTYKHFCDGYCNLRLPNNKRFPKLWFTSSRARVCNEIGFGDNLPITTLNYWCGLRRIPPGTTSNNAGRFMQFLRNCVCRKDENVFQCLLKLLARLVQRPLEKTGVSILIRDRHSICGELLLEEVLQPIFHRYYYHTNDQQVLSSSHKCFNAYMRHSLIFVTHSLFLINSQKLNGYYRLLEAPTLTTREKYEGEYVTPNLITPIVLLGIRAKGLMRYPATNQLVIEPNDHAFDNKERDNFTTYLRENVDNIHQALREVDIDGFNPKANVPMTSIKWNMLRQELPAKYAWIVHAIDIDDDFRWDVTLTYEQLYQEHRRIMRHGFEQKPISVEECLPAFREFFGRTLVETEDTIHIPDLPIAIEAARRFFNYPELFSYIKFDD